MVIAKKRTIEEKHIEKNEIDHHEHDHHKKEHDCVELFVELKKVK